MEISDIRKSKRRRAQGGYTLVEVLVASGILVAGIAAACVMSLTMGAQEEMNHRISIGLSANENAARLFQLGVSPAILPGNPNVVINVTTSTEAVAGVGSMDKAVITATVRTKDAMADPNDASKNFSATTRDSTLTVYRSSLP